MLERSVLGSARTLTWQLLGAEARKPEQLWTVGPSRPTTAIRVANPQSPPLASPPWRAARWAVSSLPGGTVDPPSIQGAGSRNPPMKVRRPALKANVT